MRLCESTFLVWMVWTSTLQGAAPRATVPAVPPEPQVAQADVVQPCPSPEQLTKWFHRIGSIEADISLGDRKVPEDCAAHLFTTASSGQSARHSSMSNHHWVAPELWHQPVYFDDVPLEQNGQTKHPLLQPPLSMARFFLSVPAMPYKMTVDRPFSCVTELGKYRPGSAAPCMLQLPPWDWRAAAVEGKTIATLILLLP